MSPQVVYVIRYSSAGEVVNASVSLVLGSVLEAAVMLKQEFQVVFIQVLKPNQSLPVELC